MDRMTMQEWTVLDETQQKAREAEMPWDVFAEKGKAEQDRLTNLNIEKDRKLRVALQQVSELDARIKALEASGAPASQIRDLEEVKRRFEDEYEKDRPMAIARLASQGVSYALSQQRQSDIVKKQALRKIRKDFSREYEKYGDALEDKLDLVTGPITADDIMVMFNSLRGGSIDDQIKEAEERGRKKALEDAGIVALDEGGPGGDKPGTSGLNKEQQEEQIRMGITEKEYKELLRIRQEKDKLESRTPRVLISPKH